MKSYARRIRAIRRLALAVCIAALAVPAGASAMLPNDSGFHPASTRANWSPQQYTLPSNFRTEVQVSQPKQQQVQPFTLHKGYRPEVTQQGPTQSSAPSPTIIRQIETVTNDSGRTLAIVLAAIALAVALASLAYASVRLAQMQRRNLGSPSH